MSMDSFARSARSHRRMPARSRRSARGSPPPAAPRSGDRSRRSRCPIRRRQAGDFLADDLDQRVVVHRLGDGCGKPVAVDRERPAGGHWLASAQRMISEPSRRISSCSKPTALLSASSERNELEQTSSARPGACASVIRRAHLVQHDGNPAWRAARRLPNRRGRRQSHGRYQFGEWRKSCAQR